jgi:putative acetyltransferase
MPDARIPVGPFGGADTAAVVVRPEVPGDVDAIFAITRAAFTGHPHSQGTEPYIVNWLRSAGGLTLSLVATVEGRAVGHVAFSPVTLSDGTEGWFGLGPVSVLPGLQRRGIGTALIQEGLARLRATGAAGVVLVGDPAYYGRFGFRHRPELTLADVPPAVFLALPLAGPIPRAGVTFHEAFGASAE